ncbi:type IV pilin protein [Candidatus Avelusimicrobium sp.]
MKKLSKVILKLLKEKREDAEQKSLSMAPCFGKGFTLIELLVVVLIIGILSAVALPQYQKAVDKARVSELFAIVKNLKVQQEAYYMANGYYAQSCEEMGADIPSGYIKNASGNYDLNKGSYHYNISCQNGSNAKTEGRSYGHILKSGFSVNIETFFDNITDTASAGRSFCYAANGNSRGMNVCKNLGTEKRNEDSYWL